MNKEFLVVMGHQPVAIMSLLFVHTARRSYRLGRMMRTMEHWRGGERLLMRSEVVLIFRSRGRRSRNKVSVGEPADGSLTLGARALLRVLPCERADHLCEPRHGGLPASHSDGAFSAKVTIV